MEIPPVFGSSAMLERLEQHLAMIRPLQGLLERVSEALGDAVGHAESEAEPGDDDILDDLVEAAERVNEVPGESRMALGAAALRAASGGRARARERSRSRSRSPSPPDRFPPRRLPRG